MADTSILTITDKKKLEEQSQQITVKDQQLSAQSQQLSEQSQKLYEQEQLLEQQALETRLYAKLNEEGRHAELGRAFSDAAFRKQLLDEYHLQEEN